jgi:hypothetical protein
MGGTDYAWYSGTTNGDPHAGQVGRHPRLLTEDLSDDGESRPLSGTIAVTGKRVPSMARATGAFDGKNPTESIARGQRATDETT